VEDPDYGRVVFHPDGTIEAEGRLDPKTWTVPGHLSGASTEEVAAGRR
jgi:hypothetical protein